MRSRELAALRDEQSLELADHGGPGKVGYRRRSRRRFKRARLRELANQRRRLGDRRLFILLLVETSIPCYAGLRDTVLNSQRLIQVRIKRLANDTRIVTHSAIQ